MQQGKARSHAKEQCKGAKEWRRNKGAKGEGSEGSKNRLKIYYNSLITNVIQGGASET